MSENQNTDITKSDEVKFDPRVKNITGQRFGMLVAIKPNGRNGGQYRWDCLCDCGCIFNASMTSITKGRVSSCGCEGLKEREQILLRESPNIGRKINGVKCLPSKEFLHECLIYDADTGILTWKERPISHFKNSLSHRMWNAHYPNTVAGRKSFKMSGERHAIVIKIGVAGCNQSFVAHRVIYAMLDIHVPSGMKIDHSDRNPFNNRPDNLRISTNAQNCQNQGRKKTKRSLPKGVNLLQHGRFQAIIRENGRQKNLGVFDTPEEASKAYNSAAKELHGEFYCDTTRMKDAGE